MDKDEIIIPTFIILVVSVLCYGVYISTSDYIDCKMDIISLKKSQSFDNQYFIDELNQADKKTYEVQLMFIDTLPESKNCAYSDTCSYLDHDCRYDYYFDKSVVRTWFDEYNFKCNLKNGEYIEIIPVNETHEKACDIYGRCIVISIDSGYYEFGELL